ncbi:hypothetical protein [Lentzea sp. HUAS12]|nr:hypothetical protein [Lentzea sp. HUAS12]
MDDHRHTKPVTPKIHPNRLHEVDTGPDALRQANAHADVTRKAL